MIFIFMASPLRLILVCKILGFWRWKLWGHNFVPFDSGNIHIAESKEPGSTFSIELRTNLMVYNYFHFSWVKDQHRLSVIEATVFKTSNNFRKILFSSILKKITGQSKSIDRFLYDGVISDCRFIQNYWIKHYRVILVCESNHVSTIQWMDDLDWTLKRYPCNEKYFKCKFRLDLISVVYGQSILVTNYLFLVASFWIGLILAVVFYIFGIINSFTWYRYD